MIFDVYFTVTTKDGKQVPGTKPKPMEWNRIVKDICGSDYVKDKVKAYRETGDKNAKTGLPAICFVGRSISTRRADKMIPTQLVMIDIDHCEDPRGSWVKLLEKFKAQGEGWLTHNVIMAHVTPSGKGLHIFFTQQGYPTLQENMQWLNETFRFDEYGEYDSVVHDFARVSFAFPSEDLLFESTYLYLNETPDWGNSLVNEQFREDDGEEASKGKKKADIKEGSMFEKLSPFTDDEIQKFENLDYRGTPVKEIIKKYMEVTGEPTSGEIHNFYNNLVKYFRCITSNDRRALLYLLPTFGHTYDECWSQIQSICRYNTLSRLPKEFYFFLKDNGYYKERQTMSDIEKDMEKDEKTDVNMPPYLPPVFRELVGTAPADFVIPCVNALLPILGTLTSYVGAVYPYDNRVHTTSFFSVIYAPPGTGKGFVERFIDLLFQDLKLRDFIQSQREAIYMRVLNTKSQNDRAPEMPHTSLRLIPPKNSEAEFLQKQQDNHGYHMFTYAAELDSWAKGVRAAGGNKDDMIRIAWDNGEYGQQFKSFNTFKGMVKLFWNVLITGTPEQIPNYFKNVENGLVTRCSFTGIFNQEYADPPKWKSLNKKALAAIRKFTERCDRETYKTPCNLDFESVLAVPDDKFDAEVDWKFQFNERKIVDCSWAMPIIQKFHKEQMKIAAENVDPARDVFRRRVGVRGFRLALLCTTLWENPKVSDLEKCKSFIDWWMHEDLESSLQLWGQKYNDTRTEFQKITQKFVFGSLGDTFTTSDVYVQTRQQDVKTPVRRILFDWKKLGLIEEVSKGTFNKIKK